MNVHRSIAHGLKGLDTDLLRQFTAFVFLRTVRSDFFKIIPFIFYVFLRLIA
jgi:hypothetical protein